MKLLTAFIIASLVSGFVADNLTCTIEDSKAPFVCFDEDEQGNFTENFEQVTTVVLSMYTDNLPDGIGETFVNLVEYYAGYLELRVVKREDFKGMSKVEVLELGDNLISELPEDVFADLESLLYVEISNNLIKFLPDKLLAENKALEGFLLYDHQVEILPKDFFVNNLNLTEVAVANGPLRSINVDFTLGPQEITLDFTNNSCIDMIFDGFYQETLNNETSSLQEFQNVIMQNCSSNEIV